MKSSHHGDYKLCIHTFLTTQMVHAQRFVSIQYLGGQGENTRYRQNRKIQRLVGLFAERFNESTMTD